MKTLFLVLILSVGAGVIARADLTATVNGGSNFPVWPSNNQEMSTTATAGDSFALNVYGSWPYTTGAGGSFVNRGGASDTAWGLKIQMTDPSGTKSYTGTSSYGAATGQSASCNLTLGAPGVWTFEVQLLRSSTGISGNVLTYTVTVAPSAPVETWTAFAELVRDWHDVTTWSPDPSTVPAGQSFTQTKEQIQEWRRGERSNVTGAERNVENYFLSQQLTQTAQGTKQKAAPVISWQAPAAITYGTPLSRAQLNASANVSGTFVYSPDTGTVLNAGGGQTLTVYFTPDDGDNYNTATATQTLTVNKAATTLTILSPASPTTLAIDSASALTVSLRRDNDGMALSTANVTYEIAETRGTAAATISLNTVTMNNGGGDDTITVRAVFGGNANHLPSAADLTFRVPRPGSLVFTATPPLISPVTLPGAFLHSEHGSTTSFLEVQVSNPGELPVEVSGITVNPELGQVASFALADENGRANTNTTLAAGQNRNFRITFRPSRYALNRDTMKINWRCRPNVTTVASGEISWTLEGQGLAPRMATIPYKTAPDLTNARDLVGQWPTLRSQ